jgi:ketosteroid isomerase-like protein
VLVVGDEQLEVVRKAHGRWERGHFGRELFDPDVVFVRVGPDGGFAGLAGEWRGVDAMSAAVAEYLEAWDEMRMEADRFIDLGDRVLVLARQSGRGRHSGVVTEREVAYLCTVRNGKIVRFEAYWDRSDGVRAAGLTP